MRHHLQPVTTLLLALACATGCKQTTPAPSPTPKPVPTLNTAAITQQASQHPTFKVAFQQPGLPTILIVPESATDDQLKALLWYLRIQTRDGHLKDLGIKPTSTTFGTPNYSTGELAIYRGPRCAHEMYAAENPCGPSIHKSASYHWGEGADPLADTASITRANGATDLIFTPDDGFQTEAQSHTDPTGALHKASVARIQFATKQNAASTKQHTDFRFAAADPDTQLRIVSYQLATEEGRKSFLTQYLTLEQDHLCPLGFKTLQLAPLGSPPKPYPIPCPT